MGLKREEVRLSPALLALTVLGPQSSRRDRFCSHSERRPSSPSLHELPSARVEACDLFSARGLLPAPRSAASIWSWKLGRGVWMRTCQVAPPFSPDALEGPAGGVLPVALASSLLQRQG